MKRQLLQLAAELTRRGESFVLAIVVRREPYTSAQPGDMALITADGAYHGWLGGNCTRPQVKREAVQALLDGKPRLISLSVEPDPHPRPGITALPMTCHSGGTVDIYIEPMLAEPRLLLFGVSPVARALAQLGSAMGYCVEMIDPEANVADLPHASKIYTEYGAPELRASTRTTYAVVASMSDSDEDAIAAALEARPAYLGVVASRKRYAAMREVLVGRGIAASELDSIKNPAGLDLGGRLPEELALSILAEIVQVCRAAPARVLTPGVEPAPIAEATDPVCGMSVVIATARHIGQWGGRAWYFCNPRCKDKFLADPKRFLEVPVSPRVAT